VRSLVRDSQSATVYARCADASGAMTALLASSGFATVGRSADDTTTLEFRRPIAPAARG
jgi:hypothetical protein